MRRRWTIVIALSTSFGACTPEAADSPVPTSVVTTVSTEVAALPPTLLPTTLPPPSLAPTTAEPPTTTTEPAPTTSTYATWADLVAAESSGVFRIHIFACSGGSTAGTGFLVAPGVIATAAHVVEGHYGFTVDQTDNAPRLPATAIAIDLAEDVALLSAPSARGFIFTLADHEPPSGTTVGLIGFSDTRAPYRPIRGDIGQLNLTNLVYGESQQFHPRRAFQHSMQTNGGDSGSPILDTQTGEVIGINVAGFTRIQGFNYAVYLDALRPLLAEQPTSVPIDGCNLDAPPTTTTTPATTVPPTTVPPTTVLPGPLTYRVLAGDTVFGTARAVQHHRRCARRGERSGDPHRATSERHPPVAGRRTAAVDHGRQQLCVHGEAGRHDHRHRKSDQHDTRAGPGHQWQAVHARRSVRRSNPANPTVLIDRLAAMDPADHLRGSPRDAGGVFGAHLGASKHSTGAAWSAWRPPGYLETLHKHLPPVWCRTVGVVHGSGSAMRLAGHADDVVVDRHRRDAEQRRERYVEPAIDEVQALAELRDGRRYSEQIAADRPGDVAGRQ